MVFAKIKDNIVINMLELRRAQSSEFPDCVEVGTLPVGIGDSYVDGKFYRDGKEVKTSLQHAQEQIVRVSEAALVSVNTACVQMDVVPASNVGMFVQGASPWEAGKEYAMYDLFSYNGAVGWVKQAHTSQETWTPFSVGTEALYGARPEPDADGVYPYVYNMKVDVGMKVLDEGVVYECIQGADELLYRPEQVPALFKVVE